MRKGYLVGLVGIFLATIAPSAWAGSCSVTGFATLGTDGFTRYTPATGGTLCGVPVTVSRPYTEDELKNATSLSGTFNGIPITITSGSPFNSIKTSKSLNLVVNGRQVVLSTSGLNIDHIAKNDSILVSVDGKTFYQGNRDAITIQDAINLMTLLGAYDSYAAVQQTVSRSESRSTNTLTSTRISSVLSSVLAPATTRSRGGGRERSASASPQSGFSYGDAEQGIGVWVSPANSWLSSSDPYGKYAGTMQNLMSGADYRIGEAAVLGLAVGFENTDMATPFNLGGVRNQAVSFTPYFGYGLFDNRITLDLMAGYAYYDGTQRRKIVDNSTVKGNFTGQRWMIATNLNGHVAVTDAITLTPTAGMMVSWDHRFRFYESDGSRPLKNDSGLVEGKLALKAAYAFETVDLYAAGAFLHDFLQDQDITAPGQNMSRNEIQVTLGTGWYLDRSTTLNLEATNSFARTYVHQTTVAANLRYTF